MADGVCEIPLTKGFVALVDEADFAWLSQWRWRYKATGTHTQGYAVRTTRHAGSARQVTIYMHRAIFGDAAPEVDHINRDKLDNRRSNLRAATRKLNQVNRSLPNRTGFRGVKLNGRQWRAVVTDGCRRIHLGNYETAEQAARAYDAAAKRLFGDFAILNFPGDATA